MRDAVSRAPSARAFPSRARRHIDVLHTSSAPLADFEPQHLPPAPSTLALAYRILQSHASSGGELLGFYNCGAVSGASQPHRHVQFIEVDGPEAEMEGRRGTPMEKLLERIERDGKEYGECE